MVSLRMYPDKWPIARRVLAGLQGMITPTKWVSQTHFFSGSMYISAGLEHLGSAHMITVMFAPSRRA